MQTPIPPVFSFSIHFYAGRRVLSITDDFDANNPSITVTNTIEYVLKCISNQVGTLPELIIYRDTEGHWNRVVVSPTGTIIRVAPIVPNLKQPVANQQTAIQLCVTDNANAMCGVA